MEVVCAGGDTGCEVSALAAALHALHLYCTILAAGIICCCAKFSTRRTKPSPTWRWQNLRGVTSLAVGVIWCCNAAAAAMRTGDHVSLVAALLAPPAWLAATWFHVTLWTRGASSPILYIFLYWLLSAATSAATLCHRLAVETTATHVTDYFHSASLILSLTLAAIDGLCFYNEVVNKVTNNINKATITNPSSYEHLDSYFFSKISFFWLNKLLRKGFKKPLEEEDLGELPDEERSEKYYLKLKYIYDELVAMRKKNDEGLSMWRCYIKMVWPNFYISGMLKLLGDMMGLVPPVGLSVVVQYIVAPTHIGDGSSPVTIREFVNNGYIMVLLITIAAIGQAVLSQNSTHLVSVEGIRLKTALQSIIFDKCMRLAPWTVASTGSDESEPLLNAHDNSANQVYSGLLTNLVSQDTYNIMSCVWVCHYLWAIPLKVTVILYLLYNKLGVSAIIGCTASILIVTPLQFYIGKRISDNSKEISKTSDHRISKMTEILHGMTVIKLYVWEDLFKEKILNLREVELKLLNKDSAYWSILTFTTQVSTILVTVITFSVYFLIEDGKELTAVNVFAGLALFSQLSIPLLVLPVTVLMVVQATISTKRIKDFLELPESNKVSESSDDNKVMMAPDKFNDAFVNSKPVDTFRSAPTKRVYAKCNGNLSDEDGGISNKNKKVLVTFRNVVMTWGSVKADSNLPSLEIDDLELETDSFTSLSPGKLIIVVGPTGSGKSSLLSAILGEMTLNRGEITWNGSCSTWYAGQPPWLLEGSVRDNILMGSSLCQRRYARVLRSTGLRPDLQLLPEGDKTVLGPRGAPLSGGQRVRVCVARALYSQAQLLVLDEPLGALDVALARHVVARGLLSAARSGRTVLLATNRLELLHYADMVIVMEECRVVSWGRTLTGGDGGGALRRWTQLAAEARVSAARAGVGPPGGTARERNHLVRALSRAKLQRNMLNETAVGVSEATGAHLLAEVPTCVGGSWRRVVRPPPSTLTRQLSSPPPSVHHMRCRRDVRRTVSADASNASLRREASVLRRLLYQRPHRTISRWTPRPLRRLLSSNYNNVNTNNYTNGKVEETSFEDIESPRSPPRSPTAGSEESAGSDTLRSDNYDSDIAHNDTSVWWEYGRACGWWGAAYWCAAVCAQGMAVAADWWLARWTIEQNPQHDKIWQRVCTYAALCSCSAIAAGCAQAACARAGAAARRTLHERLLHATLHTPLLHHDHTPLGATLHRFSSDILVIDKKLPTTVSRWAQLALLCSAATIVNAVVTPWTLLAALPAFILYLTLQSVYRRNARELQRLEAASAAPAVSLVAEVRAGAVAVRAGCLQPRMRAEYLRRLDRNHNALLLLNATNRWLGLSLDLVGAASVCASLWCALASGRGAGVAGLAGAYSLLLPAYLSHLAKCRADLDLHLAAVERVDMYSRAQQEDYRDHCTPIDTWPADGEIQLEKVSVQHGLGTPPTLIEVTLTVASGEKVAVCGRSGCGKSTLLLSCVGAASMCSGRLRVGGVDADNIPLRALRHRLVVLPQEVALFSGTLRENLDPLAVHTDDEIWQSLRVVGLREFVVAQPAGLECWVGGWSGGRAGRVSAARAVLRAPLAAALLLDEPGAALDPAAERALLASVAAIAPNTTIITVAHRVSSVRGYDRVIVIDRGRVVEQGAPTALLAEPASRFARMFSAASKDSHFTRVS